MSIEISKFPQWYLQPDISARRAKGILLYFIKERKLEGSNPFPNLFDVELFTKITTDSHLWISQELEEKIINHLAGMEDISPALYQLGKESFLTQSFDLLPTNETSLLVEELIARVPILLTRFTRIVTLEIIELTEKSAIFEFHFLNPHKAKWFDAIFFKGMLDGLSLLFELIDSKTFLRETTLLGIHAYHNDLGENIQFGGNRNIYEMKWTSTRTRVSRSNLRQEDSIKPQRSFVISRETGTSMEDLSVINVSSVISKSRELALENRDLEAAVEVLKSFKTELELKQKSIAKDLKLAKNIQKGIIPQSIPDWNGIQFWNYFSPMQEVSGDYYDYFMLENNRIGLSICDVSGHGVPAAFITALSKMLFNTYRNPSPSKIFKNVNRDLLELLMQQGYTTCVYAVIEKDYKITYSVAGHPRPILLSYKTGKASILDGEGTFLGMFPEASDHYEDNVVQLAPGDKIFLYTDGVTEAENDIGESFGEDRLAKLVEETVGKDIKESIEYISAKHNEFCMGTDQMDDITIFGFGLNNDHPQFQKLMKLAIHSYRSRNYKIASEYLKKAHTILPRELNTILLLSKSLTRELKFEEAISYLENYNNFKMHNYESHNILGYCFYMMKEYEKAEIELKKALYMNDVYPSVHYNLAKTYYKKADRNKMSIAIERLRKNFPNFVKIKELDSLLALLPK
jgi:serine phosphatase RsbU (regulator of sigma subunit)